MFTTNSLVCTGKCEMNTLVLSLIMKRVLIFHLRVINGRGLHLHGVIAVSELGQAEAADVVEVVDALWTTQEKVEPAR